MILFNPDNPLGGMRSSVDPATIRWRLIDNWDISRRGAQGRDGCDELTSGAVAAGASFRGKWEGKLNGVECVVAAYRISGATRVYSFNTSTWAATELTASGPTNTRFSTDGDVVFAPYREIGIDESTNAATEYLYISNGTSDLPRCTKSMLSNSVDFLYNFDLSSVSAGSFRPVPCGYVKIQDRTFTTLTKSGAAVTISDTGTAPADEVSISMTSSVAVNDYANIAFDANSCVNIAGNTENTSSSLDLSASQQLWLLLSDSATDPIFNYCNLEVTNNGSQVQVYDAQGAGRVDPAIISVGGGYYLVGYNLEGSVGSGLNDVEGIRFEVARTMTSTHTFKVAGVLASGRVPQGTLYEMSFATNYSRVESRGVILTRQPTAALSEYGVSRDIPYKLPDFENFFYQYRIDWGGTFPSGADATYLYRKEPEDAAAYFVADMGVSNNPYNDNNRINLKYRPSPSPGGRGPLSARAAVSTNDRLGLGGVSGGSSQVWWSDQGFPIRFKAAATDENQDGIPDPKSGISKSFPGEDVYGLVQMPGSLLGLSPTICFTSHGTYRFEGADCESLSRPTLCNNHGTIYPRSIALHRGLIHYLDVGLMVRRFAGGIETDPISWLRVEDQFENGDVTKTCAVVYKENYLLAHRASAASINQRVMVYMPASDEWVRHSYTEANQNWAGFGLIGAGSTWKLLGYTEEGRIYQVLKPGAADDDGTAITGTLTTGELHKDMWEQVRWENIGVMVDDIPSGTWTITRTSEIDSSNVGSGAGTINVDVSTTRAYRWESSSTAGLFGSAILAPSIRISISGKVQSGKFLKAIILGTPDQTVTPGADR